MSDEHKLMRRVAGYHDIRLDGISDLLLRAREASVLDVGCNRGLVGFEFANNGARLVHGCDNYEPGIRTARELFADLRNVQSRFEVVDLTSGPACLKVFGAGHYDVVVLLATYHKLKRVMPAKELSALVRYLGRLTHKFFAWRATSDKPNENEDEMASLDDDLRSAGLKRIHTSYLSDELGLAAIWARR
jgi:2-polyprenyl-3-methyl-5-hydroxy-6-metoxy-1,4-benzoquinol methylase